MGRSRRARSPVGRSRRVLRRPLRGRAPPVGGATPAACAASPYMLSPVGRSQGGPAYLPLGKNIRRAGKCSTWNMTSLYFIRASFCKASRVFFGCTTLCLALKSGLVARLVASVCAWILCEYFDVLYIQFAQKNQAEPGQVQPGSACLNAKFRGLRATRNF